MKNRRRTHQILSQKKGTIVLCGVVLPRGAVKPLAFRHGDIRLLENSSFELFANQILPQQNQDFSSTTQSGTHQNEDRVALAPRSQRPIVTAGRACFRYRVQELVRLLLMGKRPDKVKPPRFKKKSNRQSARFARNSFRFKNGVLRLSKIGAIPIVWHRRVSGEPSSVVLSMTPAGRYYVSFQVEQPLPVV